MLRKPALNPKLCLAEVVAMTGTGGMNLFSEAKGCLDIR